MRKELVWVAIIGICVGLAVAFGVYRINDSLKSRLPAPEATPVSGSPRPEFKITLDKPDDNDVVTNDTVNVSGITKPLTWLTVSGESGDYIIESNEDGAFSQDVDLTAGVNQILVSAFDSQGTQSTTRVLVVYSSAFEEKAFESTGSQSATSETAVRDKVAQKVAEALNKPKAYIGTVTDIADSTIQIKSIGSEIEQISTSEEGISVVDTTGTTNKAVKLTDIAIGDFIVAMGYVNSNSVLIAQRILITDPVTDPKIASSIAKITDIPKKGVNVTGLKKSETATILPDSKTLYESFLKGETKKIRSTDVSQGDLIIYTVDTSGNSPKVRAIFVVAVSEG